MRPVFVITGPSGAGKGTLIRALVERVPDARGRDLRDDPAAAARRGERTRVLVPDRGRVRRARVARGRFPRAGRVRLAASATGRCARRSTGSPSTAGCACSSSSSTARSHVQDEVPGACTIFIAADVDELERRLRERATESTGEIDDRITLARLQLEQAHRFRYMVRNDDVTRASEVLAAIVERELELAGTMAHSMIEPRIDELLLAHEHGDGSPVAVRARDRGREAGPADQQLPPSARRGHRARGRAAAARRVALEELPDDGDGGDLPGQAHVRVRRAVERRSSSRRSLPVSPDPFHGSAARTGGYATGTMCAWRASSSGSPAASRPTRPASSCGCSSAPGTT